MQLAPYPVPQALGCFKSWRVGVEFQEAVTCYISCLGPVVQRPRTLAFQAGNAGSNPVGTAKFLESVRRSLSQARRTMSAQSVEFYNTLLAILTIVMLVAAVGLLGYRLVAGKEAALNLFGSGGVWLAWIVAAVATAGSLVYSEVIHFVPCRLCWFQRIAMYPMAVILLVGAIRREVVVRYYALPLALGGALISIWHYLTQTFPSLEGGSCDPINPCSAKYVDVFGFVSIPFMAGTGFIVISILLAFYVRTTHE